MLGSQVLAAERAQEETAGTSVGRRLPYLSAQEKASASDSLGSNSSGLAALACGVRCRWARREMKAVTEATPCVGGRGGLEGNHLCQGEGEP